MNKTRRDWAEFYKCYVEKETSLTAYYILAAVVITVAIGFYPTVYLIRTNFPTIFNHNTHDVSINNEDSAASDPEPDTSSSSSSVQGNNKQTKSAKLTIEDSEDDEMLVENNGGTSQTQQLITI